VKNGGSASNNGAGTAWVNLTANIVAEDGESIYCDATGTKSLVLDTFSFTVPAGSVIGGVEVVISKGCADPSACTDNEIKLKKGTNTFSNSLAEAPFWSTVNAESTYGGCGNIWGFGSLSVAEVNSAQFSIYISGTSSTSTTFRVDMVKITVFYSPLTTGSITTGSITTGSISTGAGIATTGSRTTGEITTGSPPITSGQPDVTTSVADATTGEPITSGTRVTTGQARVTTGSVSRVTTGVVQSTTTSPGNTTATTTEGERSGSNDGTMTIIYGVIGAIGFILIAVIIVLLAVYVKRRGPNNRARARMLGLPRSTNDEEMTPLEKRELPDVDEKELPVDVHKIAEKIQKLDKPIDFPGANGYSLEFNFIEKKTAHHGATEDYSTAHAEANFLTKNRFRNVLPPEKTRVKLAPIEGIDGSDYINANFLSGLVKNTEKAYIATQGPLPTTINDFWRMVWEQNSSVVLNLTREFENGRQKSERYWPETSKQPFEAADFTISLKEEVENYTGELVTRKLLLTKKADKDSKEESRTITQYHYIGWPDHGVPEHTDAYIQLAEGADNTNTSNGPIVVHCSAGIGRTGTFITIHSLLELIKEKLKEDKSNALTINISDVIVKLREQRSGMVQTPEQYEFTYHAIRDVIGMYLDPKKKEEKEIERKKFEKERIDKQKAKEAELAKEKEAEKAKEMEKEKEEKEKKEKEEKEKEKEKEKKDEEKEKKHTKRREKKRVPIHIAFHFFNCID